MRNWPLQWKLIFWTGLGLVLTVLVIILFSYYGSSQAQQQVQRDSRELLEQEVVARMQHVVHAIEQINDMATQIATAAEEQHQVSEDINQNVTAIGDVALQVSEGADQTSAASGRLSELAAELRRQIQVLKIE